jgi:hypothetical protein
MHMTCLEETKGPILITYSPVPLDFISPSQEPSLGGNTETGQLVERGCDKFI